MSSVLRLIVLLSTVVVHPSCAYVATIESQQAKVEDFQLRAIDNLVAKRFDLELTAVMDKSICLTMSQWPSRSGWLDGGSQVAKVVSGDKVFPAADRTFGYAAGLIYVIAPGETLKGFVPYSEFGNADEIAKLSSRSLEFTISPWICSKSDLKENNGEGGN